MSPPPEFADVPTPIGTFRIVYDGNSVQLIDLLERGLEQTGTPIGARQRKPPYPAGSPPAQLGEYFRGKRSDFEVNLQPMTGSDFDRSVWDSLVRVRPGQTVTYGELARRAGHPGAARAVGGAMHRNPIPVVIPCHRVVGDGGSLTGYGLGLWRKRWLLDFEGAWPLKSKTPEGPRDPAQRTLDDAESSGKRRPRSGARARRRRG